MLHRPCKNPVLLLQKPNAFIVDIQCQHLSSKSLNQRPCQCACSWANFEDAGFSANCLNGRGDTLRDGRVLEEVLAQVFFGFYPIGFGDHVGRIEQSVFRGLNLGHNLAFLQGVENGAKSRGA